MGSPETIKLLTELVSRQTAAPAGAKPSDELDRHRLRLENDLTSMTAEVQELGHVIARDDENAANMAKFQLSRPGPRRALCPRLPQVGTVVPGTYAGVNTEGLNHCSTFKLLLGEMTELFG